MLNQFKNEDKKTKNKNKEKGTLTYKMKTGKNQGKKRNCK